MISCGLTTMPICRHLQVRPTSPRRRRRWPWSRLGLIRSQIVVPALPCARRVYDGGEAPVTTPPAFIVASACKLNHGVRIADLGDLWGHVTSVLDTLGKHKAFHFYVGTHTQPTHPATICSCTSGERQRFGMGRAGRSLGLLDGGSGAGTTLQLAVELHTTALVCPLGC